MKSLIRDYDSSDYQACRSLWAELTQRHRDIYDDPTIGGEDPGQGIDSYLRNGDRRATWVAEVDGKVVGMTGLIVHGDEASVEPVVVAASHRGRGIGGKLLECAINNAKEIGIRFLSVQPVARNAEAIAFFVRAGFHTVGHVDLFQDLDSSQNRRWKTGITIHGERLRY